MTHKENITAILECYFAGFKKELIDSACERILEQQPCEDCISREELLKAIDTWDKFGCDADTKLVPYKDHYIPYVHYDDVVKCIKGMPSVTPKGKTSWIPVSERLPEDYQRVLVTVVRYNGNNIVRVAEYYNRNNGKGVFLIQENHEQWEVGEKGLLAWMPLPEPYKADKEVENDD